MKTLRDKIVFDPPPLGTVLWYPGLPGAGSLIYDRSLYGNHGTITGATWTRNSKGLWGLNFDGDDYVNIDGVIGDLAATGYMSCWMKTNDNTVDSKALICLSDIVDIDNLTRLDFRQAATGKLACNLVQLGGTQWGLITDNTVFANNVLTHVAITHNGTQPTLIVNGVAVAQTFTASGNKTKWFNMPQLNAARIGMFDWGAYGKSMYWNGQIFLEKMGILAKTEAQFLNEVAQEKSLFGVW